MAQNHDFQLWQPVYLDIPLRRRWHGYFESSPREGEGVSQLKQLILRSGLEYRQSETLSLMAGYAWNYQPHVAGEHRP